MTRIVALTAVKAGITRLRNKGSANPDSLYDLLNGYVSPSRAPVIRPGTVVRAVLPEGTKGLCIHNDIFHVFSGQIIAMTDSQFECDVLLHPTNPSVGIADVHFASPIVGALYVSAEFLDGAIYHYWLQRGNAWEADTVYPEGTLIEPTTVNGLVYRAVRVDAPGVVWAPNVARTIGDEVEPTTPNGYKYEVTDTEGDNPASGSTEPVWPTEEGAIIYEDGSVASASDVTTTSDTTTNTDSTTTSGTGDPDRYNYSGIKK